MTRLIGGLGLLGLAACSAGPAAAVPPDPQVLILNSYHPGFRWSDEEVAGVLERLHQAYPHLETPLEYLDTWRHPRPEETRRVKESLRAKYEGRRFDLVVALDNAALDLLLAHRAELFPGAPIAFAGVNDYRPEKLAGQEEVTGVAEVLDLAGTLRTALALHPRAKEVLVIHDDSVTDLALRRELETVAPVFQARARISFTAAPTFAQVVDHLRALGPDGVGLLLPRTADRDGQSLSLDAFTSLLTGSVDLPVYAVHETRLGHGVVGGILLGGREHGRRAGDLALRILAGESASAIPVVTETTARPMFDHRQLARFNLPESALPPGSVVINRPASVYEMNRPLVLSGLAALLSLALVVVVLAVSMLRRRRLEETLRASEERFRSVFEQAAAGISYSALDGRYLKVNPRFCAITGYEAAELQGMNFRDIIHPDDLPLSLDNHRRLLAGESDGYAVEKRYVRRDGRVVWVKAAISPVRRPAGGLESLVAVVEDITERVRAEAALRQSEEKFAKAFRQSPAWVALVTLEEGRYLEVNESFLRDMGYVREEVIGRTTRELATWPDPEDRRRLVRAVRETGSVRNLEMVRRTKSGRLLTTLLSSDLITIDGEEYLLSVSLDITERQAQEEARRKLEAQLRQAHKMEALGTLAGGIAHDFNNILAAIMGYAELGAGEMGEAHPARHCLSQILLASQRAKGLVQQILTASRPVKENRQPLQIYPILDEALKLLRASLPSTVEIRSDLQPHRGRVLADPTQVHQVLMNLATNSAHAMRETGGLLSVRLNEVELDQAAAAEFAELEPGPYLRLTVSDTGHGMDPATLERIFDPFFTTKKPGEGTGMGLAVVHGIVRGHGGQIAVASRPGQGTTCQVYLPLTDLPPSAEAGEETPAPLQGRERILVVDDEPVLADLVQRMLGHLGYQTTGYTSALEALAAFKTDPQAFDLLLTDQTMPHLTGFQLAQEVRGLRPDLPVVLCTGFSETVSPERAQAGGIRAYLMKPLTLADLAATVRRALDGQGADGK